MDVYLVERPPEPPAPERRRSPVASVVVWVLVLVLFAGTGAMTLSAILGETGVSGFVVGAVLAAVPVVPVVATFLWLDRYEAEPRALLLFAFGWGAAVATLVSLVINTASVSALSATGGDPTAAAVFVAPVVEETAKGLAVVGVLLLRRREFDGVIDGIVYAGMAGIGFAAVENVLYLGRALLETGGTGTVVVFVVRCLFSPFAHPLFTIAIGIGVGVAVRTRRRPLRVVAPLLGWAAAVLLHGAWNLSAVSGLSGFLSAYVLFQVPVFAGVVVLAVLARRREARLVQRHLEAYTAAGWLSPAELAMLASLPARRRALDWAADSGGRAGTRAMREFQELATELAFLRERMGHGTAPAHAPRLELQMLNGMVAARVRFLPQPLARR
jgi:protease PrsW